MKGQLRRGGMLAMVLKDLLLLVVVETNSQLVRTSSLPRERKKPVSTATKNPTVVPFPWFLNHHSARIEIVWTVMRNPVKVEKRRKRTRRKRKRRKRTRKRRRTRRTASPAEDRGMTSDKTEPTQAGHLLGVEASDQPHTTKGVIIHLEAATACRTGLMTHLDQDVFVTGEARVESQIHHHNNFVLDKQWGAGKE
ncbi:hypothetical protein IWX49DRAFT_578353 [Phyllosticta citricarpa]